MTVSVQTTTSIRGNGANGNFRQDGDAVEDHDLAASLRPIYVQLISDLNLPPLERFESEKLMAAVLEAAAATGVPHPPHSHSYESLLVGYSYADVSCPSQRDRDILRILKRQPSSLQTGPQNCYPYHPLDVKVYVAIYTWLATLCDDAERVGIVEDVALFQEHWVKGEPQPTILLRAFAEQIRLSYEYWHPLVANLIVDASFALLTATALGARNGSKWPPRS